MQLSKTRREETYLFFQWKITQNHNVSNLRVPYPTDTPEYVNVQKFTNFERAVVWKFVVLSLNNIFRLS